MIRFERKGLNIVANVETKKIAVIAPKKVNVAVSQMLKLVLTPNKIPPKNFRVAIR